MHISLNHFALVVVLATTAPQSLGQHQHDAGHQHGAEAKSAAKPAADARLLVKFPERMRDHTLANMRDHLLALSEIQEALSKGWFDKAADTAEKRLGMTSLTSHGAHDVSKLMPKGMQEIGTSMHRNASQFSVEAKNAGATGDIKPALAALARTTQSCVACHAAYRFQ